jgi:hypothetical protein
LGAGPETVNPMHPVNRCYRLTGKLREFASSGPPKYIHLEKSLLRMQETQGPRRIRQVPCGEGWHARFVPRDFDWELEAGECLLPFQDWDAIGKNTPKPKP